MDLGPHNPYLASEGLVQRYSYDAWGRERNANTWSGNPASPSGHVDVHRGFTGHELLRHLGLVHMGGRIYDPVLGRFLSADPFVQAPGNLQNYNRYGYVLNNPLSYTDPSGFFFNKLFRAVGDFVKQYWRPILAIALAAFGQWYMLSSVGLTAGSTAHLLGSALVGAISGGIAGGAQGALWGALGGFAFASIGAISADWEMFQKVLAHGITGGAMSEAQGGSFALGFAAQGISKASGGWIANNVPGEYTGQVVASAVVGGTVSKIGGGKFGNGAVTGAFGHVFNRMTENAFVKDQRAKSAIVEENEFEFTISDTWKENVSGAGNVATHKAELVVSGSIVQYEDGRIDVLIDNVSFPDGGGNWLNDHNYVPIGFSRGPRLLLIESNRRHVLDSWAVTARQYGTDGSLVSVHLRYNIITETSLAVHTDFVSLPPVQRKWLHSSSVYGVRGYASISIER